MSSRESSIGGEIHDVKESAKNRIVHNRHQRHSQKAEGGVPGVGGIGTSKSSISPGGIERAITTGERASFTFGQTLDLNVSPEVRTKETLDAMAQGIKEMRPDIEISDDAPVRALLKNWTGGASPEFIAEHNRLWEINKTELLAKRGLTSDKFSTLTADEQEEIAEAAQEPVIVEWLDNKSSELARLYPPREAAARFAVYFDEMNGGKINDVKNNERYDALHGTHKTVTEAFLASGVLIRRSDNQRIEKITDLGGTLQVLDGWDSITEIDSKGGQTITIDMRGQVYTVDQTLL